MKNVKGGSYSKTQCDKNTNSFAISSQYVTIKTQAVQKNLSLHNDVKFKGSVCGKHGLSFAMPKNQCLFGEQ